MVTRFYIGTADMYDFEDKLDCGPINCPTWQDIGDCHLAFFWTPPSDATSGVCAHLAKANTKLVIATRPHDRESADGRGSQSVDVSRGLTQADGQPMRMILEGGDDSYTLWVGDKLIAGHHPSKVAAKSDRCELFSAYLARYQEQCARVSTFGRFE